MKKFKIRASCANKIMGRMGLTEAQTEKLNELLNRVKPMTDNMKIEFAKLQEAQKNPQLPVGCITYLKEWYAAETQGFSEEIRSKYFDKGNMVEDENIDVSVNFLGLGFGIKNEQFFEDEYKTGTPDLIVQPVVVDVKSPWDYKTFLDTVMGELSEDYKAQLRVYADLAKCTRAVLCHTLLDTPEEANYGVYVDYSSIPLEKRFYKQEIELDQFWIAELHTRVELCRIWLDQYHIQVQTRLRNALV